MPMKYRAKTGGGREAGRKRQKAEDEVIRAEGRRTMEDGAVCNVYTVLLRTIRPRTKVKIKSVTSQESHREEGRRPLWPLRRLAV